MTRILGIVLAAGVAGAKAMTRHLGIALAAAGVVMVVIALVQAMTSSPSSFCRELHENGQVTSCTVRP
jgi:hypothetical protein